ncbi:MAG: NAD-dependent epimerase/dehydratase family protein [Aristaeellaceae bacterium]
MQRIDLNGKTVLVTGSPGFIGANLVLRLLREMNGGTVVSLDNMNGYYDPALKAYRLGLIEQAAVESPVEHVFVKGSIADRALVNALFEKYHFDVVVNLAAQAGVRHSIDHPDAYIESNLIGFYNILEACRHNPVAHLVYASSSSVYGGNRKVPFSTDDKVDNPVSLYAATKKSNELLAHAYAKLYDIPSTGLRFFTVYGPAGRPDMFYYSATKKLAAGETIRIFNYGNCRRDFTYIDDIVEGVYRVMQGAPDKATGADGLPVPPYAVYNIGGGTPENLLDYIGTLQEELVRAGVLPADYDFEGHRELVGMQPGDVPVTYADSTALERDYGFTPRIGIREGLRAFAQWYAEYYNPSGCRADLRADGEGLRQSGRAGA